MRRLFQSTRETTPFEKLGCFAGLAAGAACGFSPFGLAPFALMAALGVYFACRMYGDKVLESMSYEPAPAWAIAR